MKYTKYTLIILFLSIIVNVINVKAGLIYKRILVIETLKNQNTTYTDFYEKNDWSNPKYTHLDMFTTLTNPCNNCKVLIKMRNKNDGTVSTGIVPQIGNSYFFSGTVAKPDNYRLSLQREDFTLLETTIKGHWFLNDQGIESVG